MNIVKQFLYFILNTGIFLNTHPAEKKRIRLLNSFCISWICFLIPFAISDFIFSDDFGGIMMVHLFSGICLTFIIWMQSKKWYQPARITFILVLLFVLAIVTNYVEVGDNSEIIYFLMPIVSILLVHNRWVNIAFTFLSFLLFFLPNYLLHYYENGIFENPMTIASVFLGIYIAFSYSKNLNLKNEKELEIAYIELEESKKNELAQLQLKSLKAQMNPHFMFNAINSIQSLVLKGKKREAYTYMSKFSEMIRENLMMSEKSFVAMEDEVSLLRKYLELEKLRFKENFFYEITGEKELEKVKIPSMIIQPFVENAIKHGLFHKTTGNKILSISFAINNEVVMCVVKDNGVGMEKSQEIKKLNESTHQSFSTKAIKERLELLRDYYQTDIGFEYISVDLGTEVVVRIPFLK